MKTELNYDEEKAREALADLEPFMLHVRQNGAASEDVGALAAVAVSSALLALVGEVRGLREETRFVGDQLTNIEKTLFGLRR